MKKRIFSLALSLVLALFCLPVAAFAEGDGKATQNAFETTYEFDDFVRYGEGEEYAIVPCSAGSSCVELDSGAGTRLQLWTSRRKNNMIWTLVKVGNYYAVKNKWNGKVVDVPGGNAKAGTELQCNDYNGTDSQLWLLESLGDGTYAIHSKINHSLIWDVKGGEIQDNGTAINLYTPHGKPNQRFRLVHVSTIEPMSEWGSSRQDCNGSNWSVWDGSVSYDWYAQNTSQRDLYINSAADLFGLVSYVANGYEMAGKTIHLTRDINLAGIQWTPIGANGHWFRGSFNGHNHTIIGLTCTGSDDYRGLFGMVAGGTICNLSVKGTVSGDDHVGGIVGILQYGHLCNIYSEVAINNCTDVREGGICGAVAFGGMVDHCTQNATVFSTDYDSQRGGIAGYSDGTIRYSVNNAMVNHNWDCGGGIAGESGGGVFEFCANHGVIGGGSNTEYNGGIVGRMNGGGIIFGCYNDGSVFTNDNDYVGGIIGKMAYDWLVICCINEGRVYGDDQIGGICGEGRPIKCLNTGVVTGDDEVGAISGNAKLDTPYCYALSYSAANLSGKQGSRAEWVSSADFLSGRICYQLNMDSVTSESYGITAPFTQNIGSDPIPTFGSSAVLRNGDNYVNSEFRVTAECDRGYGTIEGAGSYQSGETVTLTAKPSAGCVFDHFEVKASASSGNWIGFNGSKYDYPTVTISIYNEETITLTTAIDKSYTVRGVFKIYDATPADLKVTVKLELECTNDVSGWNNDIIPVDLVDSAGVEHHWSASRNDLSSKGAKVTHTFDLGTASPISVHVFPNFGGGFTFHDYGLRARIWINDSGNAMESQEVTINSYPFITSLYGDNYMDISFENYGNSKVDGESFSKCSDAWNRAKRSSDTTIVLTSAWLLDSPLILDFGQNVTVDLNGYPIIRTIKKTQDGGELFHIRKGATLNIIDSDPTRQSSGNFKGGSIQGGRSNNTGGLIECEGKLIMTGGTLYNGGTTDKGGAIKLTGSAYCDLTGVLISDCWTDKAVFTQNEGGAIYMSDNALLTMKNCVIRNCRAQDYGGAIYIEDDGNRLSCENVDILRCNAAENQGGGVYQDYGETNWIGGSIVNCTAGDDDGGGFYVNNGKVTMRNVLFDGNNSGGSGGAFCSDSRDGTWFFGCTFQRNNADDQGGAIYVDNDNIYMEDCTVVSNGSGDEGGGLYLAGPSTVGFAGTIVIRNNNGTESFDNLVLGSNAFIYNHGLNPGSEIHLRGESDGSVKLGGSLMSEYQLTQYFRADYGTLELTDVQTVNTELRASVFSEGFTVIIIGAVVLVGAIAGGSIYFFRKRKGDTN